MKQNDIFTICNLPIVIYRLCNHVKSMYVYVHQNKSNTQNVNCTLLCSWGGLCSWGLRHITVQYQKVQTLKTLYNVAGIEKLFHFRSWVYSFLIPYQPLQVYSTTESHTTGLESWCVRACVCVLQQIKFYYTNKDIVSV